MKAEDFFTGVLWFLAYITVGFFVGTYFNPALSTDLAATNWADLIVYMWMLLWPFFLFFKFLFWAILFGVCFFIGVMAYKGMTN